MSQPIILKKNNTPKRPGNYVYANFKPDGGRYATVVRGSESSGNLYIYIGDGLKSPVSSIEFWSDELGPIEFEDEKQAKESGMRKVTVRQGDLHPEVVLEDGDTWTVSKTLHRALFGEPSPESREYYIVPAASAVEMELNRYDDMDNAPIRMQSINGTEYLDSDGDSIFGVELNRGETRRVTCFVHGVEPSEDHIPDVTKKVEESDVQESSEPQRLRTGWFEWNRERYDAMESRDGNYVVITPPLDKATCYSLSSLKSWRVKIHWHDEPADGKEAIASKIRVTDGERLGLCYSMYSEFDIYWDDGDRQLNVSDLSYVGARKVEPEKPPVEIKPGQRWRLYGTKDSECKVIRVSDDFYGVTVNDVLQEFPDTASKADLQAWLNDNAEYVPEETA